MEKSFEKVCEMKIGFSVDTNKKDAGSGKHKFFIRLAKEFKKNNIVIDNKNPNVYIYLPGDKPNKKAKINILRLDNRADDMFYWFDHRDLLPIQ